MYVKKRNVIYHTVKTNCSVRKIYTSDIGIICLMDIITFSKISFTNINSNFVTDMYLSEWKYINLSDAIIILMIE